MSKAWYITIYISLLSDYNFYMFLWCLIVFSEGVFFFLYTGLRLSSWETRCCGSCADSMRRSAHHMPKPLFTNVSNVFILRRKSLLGFSSEKWFLGYQTRLAYSLDSNKQYAFKEICNSLYHPKVVTLSKASSSGQDDVKVAWWFRCWCLPLNCWHILTEKREPASNDCWWKTVVKLSGLNIAHIF